MLVISLDHRLDLRKQFRRVGTIVSAGNCEIIIEEWYEN
jgi:hypothetical protein